MIYSNILYKPSFSEQIKNMNKWYEQEKILQQPQVISRSLQIFPGHLTLGFPSVSVWITKYKQKQLTKPSVVGSPGGPVVKTSFSNAEGAGSIPYQEAKIPHVLQPKIKKKKPRT